MTDPKLITASRFGSITNQVGNLDRNRRRALLVRRHRAMKLAELKRLEAEGED